MATALPQKLGFYTIRRYAYLICKAIVIFRPVWLRYFKDRPALIDALDTLNLACSVIIEEIDQAKKDIYPP
jgi:hypothetical protein